MLLTTTLCLGAAALVVNFWLTMRIGRLRSTTGVTVGDGGNELLQRRMRAQLNFAEQVPLTLLLVALVELAGSGGGWLAPLGALFILGRVAHAIGMDGGFRPGRPIGMVTGLVLQLALIIAALVTVLGQG